MRLNRHDTLGDSCNNYLEITEMKPIKNEEYIEVSISTICASFLIVAIIFLALGYYWAWKPAQTKRQEFCTAVYKTGATATAYLEIKEYCRFFDYKKNEKAKKEVL